MCDCFIAIVKTAKSAVICHVNREYAIEKRKKASYHEPGSHLLFIRCHICITDISFDKSAYYNLHASKLCAVGQYVTND